MENDDINVTRRQWQRRQKMAMTLALKNGNPTVIKHAVPETGSMKILNYRQSAILKLKENNACNNCIHDLAC